jgi:hypothetical protein
VEWLEYACLASTAKPQYHERQKEKKERVRERERERKGKERKGEAGLIGALTLFPFSQVSHCLLSGKNCFMYLLVFCLFCF